MPLRLGVPPDVAGIQASSLGKTFRVPERRGKYLLFYCAGAAAGPVAASCPTSDPNSFPGFYVHLGMSGQLRLQRPGTPRPPHTHFEWMLKGRPATHPRADR